jgi:multicomponent Na+:H+ antiporter subunit A
VTPDASSGGSVSDRSGGRARMTSLILATAARALFHTIVVFSLFLLFAGHDNPGGGFIGGLVAAAALVLRYVAGDADDTRRLMRVAPEHLLGVGGLLAVGAGVVGPLAGAAFLEDVALEWTGLPVVGDISVTSVLVFDIGVYLIVIGVVYAILSTLGGEMDT